MYEIQKETTKTTNKQTMQANSKNKQKWLLVYLLASAPLPPGNENNTGKQLKNTATRWEKTANQYKQTQKNTNGYKQIQTNTNKIKNTNTNKYKQISSNINKYPQHLNKYSQTSTNTHNVIWPIWPCTLKSDPSRRPVLQQVK